MTWQQGRDAHTARPQIREQPMSTTTVDLLASCLTTAGDDRPTDASEVSPIDIRERVREAARAGFRGFGLAHADLVRIAEQMGYAGLRTLLDDNGIVHLELEMLNDWYANGSRRAASDVVRADLLTAAKELGPRHIKVGGEVGGIEWPMDRLAEEFHNLCAQAAEAGTRIALEPMPFGQIRDLATRRSPRQRGLGRRIAWHKVHFRF
jgi:sugar phosphate isomerase/epimerase